MGDEQMWYNIGGNFGLNIRYMWTNLDTCLFLEDLRLFCEAHAEEVVDDVVDGPLGGVRYLQG